MPKHRHREEAVQAARGLPLRCRSVAAAVYAAGLPTRLPAGLAEMLLARQLGELLALEVRVQFPAETLQCHQLPVSIHNRVQQ